MRKEEIMEMKKNFSSAKRTLATLMHHCSALQIEKLNQFVQYHSDLLFEVQVKRKATEA